ncbi:MAG: TlpA disulfide reductase family protein [Akkermansia sp.]|nr:TlpA disulfide reductase family protein [Akkermansia sp.]
MNIKNVFHAVLALGLMAATPAVMAQDTDAPAPAKKAAKGKKEATKEPSAVGKALQEMTFLTDKKPNPDAKYYIYLQSASWCGPCNAEMPTVVKQYKTMGKRVELILVSHDNSADAAIKFMKKYGADFPCILANSGESGKLPAFKFAGGIPNASVVKANGKEIINTHAGAVIGDWKKYTRK